METIPNAPIVKRPSTEAGSGTVWKPSGGFSAKETSSPLLEVISEVFQCLFL
nr:hypothetical protein [Nostoc sp. NZL]